MGKGQMILILTQDWPTWYDSTQSFPKHERTFSLLETNSFISMSIHQLHWELPMVNVADCKRVKTWTWVIVLRSQAFNLRSALKLPSASADEAGDTSSKRTSIAERLDRQLSSKKLHLYLEIIGASSSLSFSFSFFVAVCYDIPKYWGGDKSISVPST